MTSGGAKFRTAFWGEMYVLIRAQTPLSASRTPKLLGVIIVQLRLCESLALGEKRFVSVVEFADQKFLVGGTGTSLALLAVLSDKAQPHKNREDQDASVWEFVNGELTRKSGCA